MESVKGRRVVSVIIVSYNTKALLRECLKAVRASTHASTIELVVIDNASRDGSPDELEGAFPDVRLIRSEHNLGFAAANNRAAESTDGELLLLLNPDTVVLDGAIDRLVEFARRRPEAGIWGGRTLNAARELDPSSCWQRQTIWNTFCRGVGLSGLFPDSGLFNAEAYGGWARDTEREVDIVSGCFLLITRDLWRRLGGFDEAFFMYGEDADLCLRARALGARPAITPRATIVHYGGASETVQPDKMVRLLRAKVQLVRRHWRPLTRWWGVSMLRLWALTRAIRERRRKPRSAPANWTQVWARRSEWTGGLAG